MRPLTVILLATVVSTLFLSGVAGCVNNATVEQGVPSQTTAENGLPPLIPLQPTSTGEATPTLSSGVPRLPPSIQPVSAELSGTNSPPNPGGPEIELVLTNISNTSIFVLSATLYHSFPAGSSEHYLFPVDGKYSLLPGQSVSQRHIVIGGLLQYDSTIPIRITGMLEGGEQFDYIYQARYASLLPRPEKYAELEFRFVRVRGSPTCSLFLRADLRPRLPKSSS
jgi:hypothetical protein